jgi:hypothetical protein
MDRPLGDEPMGEVAPVRAASDTDNSGVGTLAPPDAAGPDADATPGADPPRDGNGTESDGADEGDGDGAAEAGAPDAVAAPAHPVHRLRDLDRAGRAWAALFTVGLLLAPLLAFAWAAPDWLPANDPALMGLRVRDVGTSATPLTGQPSTSSHYVGGDQNVDHPGATHFYLMAPFVRVFGVAVGMVLSSALIVAACVLVSAWAVFRQLGRGAGVVAALALGAITFTTGASALVDPVSSNMAGYPLLASAALLWCLLCGDVRLLPLAAGVVSFTSHQHLSVLPALLAATGLTVGAAALSWVRARAVGRTPEAAAMRRHLARWAGGAALVALVLWTPLLVEEVAGSPGNLSMMVEFAGHGERESVGPGKAFNQLAHALGLPPLLGRTNLGGHELIASPSWFTWATAGAVVVLLGALAWSWRRTHPRRLALVGAIAAVAVGGFLNGMSVPDSLEQYRIVFYHWAWPLQLLVAVALGLAAGDLARRFAPSGAWRAARPALAGAALLGVVVPAVVNPSLDRVSNTFPAAHSPIERGPVDELVDEIVENTDGLTRDTLLMSRGGLGFDGIAEGVAVLLDERGVEVAQSSRHVYFVDDEHLTRDAEVDGGLMIVVDYGTGDFEPPGELVAEADVEEGFDGRSYRRLREALAEAGGVAFGPGVEDEFPDVPAELFALVEDGVPVADPDATFARLTPDAVGQFTELARAGTLATDPARALFDPTILRTVIDHPVLAPHLDTGDLRSLLDTLPEGWDGSTPLRLAAYRLDRAEVLAHAYPGEV